MEGRLLEGDCKGWKDGEEAGSLPGATCRRDRLVWTNRLLGKGRARGNGIAPAHHQGHNCKP